MKKEKSSDQKNSLKRNIIEWVVIITVIGGIYFSGYGPEVIGTLQRGLLATGILRPDTDIDPEEVIPAWFNFTLENESGELLSFSEFRGKTIFLNFWATWCPPCIAEMPNIQKLYDDVGNQDDLVFVMLSLDEDPDKARAFVKRKEFDFPIYFLRSRRPGVYNSTAIPTTYVISPEGEIVLEKKGMSNYNTDEFREFLLSL
jgi:thiol-disulfide isomerase/thioredoxin